MISWMLFGILLGTGVAGLTTPMPAELCPQANACIGGSYCSHRSATCEDSKCLCRDENYEMCTCLPHVGTCLIESNSGNARASANFNAGVSQSLYSCTPTEINPNYNVHVIGNYENINTRPPQAGNTEVSISVADPDSRPIILVFTSYEPVNWKLIVANNIVIDTVILMSYYLDQSNITPVREGSVQNIIRHPERGLFGYGSDSGGGHTADLLQYVQQQYGSIASFTGCYRADQWSLNIRGTAMMGNTNEPDAGNQDMTTPKPELCPQAPACIHWYDDKYFCSNSIATCEDMTCVCRQTNYDLCSCLPHVGTCQIESNSGNARASANYNGVSQSLHSCTPTEINPNYNVHVIGNYENINTRPPQAGNTEVSISVADPDSRPIILVFTSYEPVNWKLNVANNTVIDTVILMSYYLDQSNITPIREGSIQNIIRHPERGLFGYGSDSGGGHTADLLDYVQQQYGDIASFTGCYRANHWSLYIRGTGMLENTIGPDSGSMATERYTTPKEPTTHIEEPTTHSEEPTTHSEEPSEPSAQANFNTLIYVVGGVGGLIAFLIVVLIVVLSRRASSRHPESRINPTYKESVENRPPPPYAHHVYAHSLPTISGMAEVSSPPIYSEIDNSTENMTNEAGYITVIN